MCVCVCVHYQPSSRYHLLLLVTNEKEFFKPCKKNALAWLVQYPSMAITCSDILNRFFFQPLMCSHIDMWNECITHKFHTFYFFKNSSQDPNIKNIHKFIWPFLHSMEIKACTKHTQKYMFHILLFLHKGLHIS